MQDRKTAKTKKPRMPRNNKKKRSLLPWLVGGILFVPKGCVCQITVQESDPLEDKSHRIHNSPVEEGGNYDSEQQQQQQQQGESKTRKEPLDQSYDKDIIQDAKYNPPPPVGATTIKKIKEEEIHEPSHTDYIHQVEDENNTERHMEGIPRHDPDTRVSTEQAPNEEEEEEEETSVPTFTIEQLRTLLQTLEGEHNVNHLPQNKNRSWKSSDLVDEEVTGPKVIEDDRTLLDIFGEAAKQFLTQQVVRSQVSIFVLDIKTTALWHGRLILIRDCSFFVDTRNKPRMQMGLEVTEL